MLTPGWGRLRCRLCRGRRRKRAHRRCRRMRSVMQREAHLCLRLTQRSHTAPHTAPHPAPSLWAADAGPCCGSQRAARQVARGTCSCSRIGRRAAQMGCSRRRCGSRMRLQIEPCRHRRLRMVASLGMGRVWATTGSWEAHSLRLRRPGRTRLPHWFLRSLCRLPSRGLARICPRKCNRCRQCPRFPRLSNTRSGNFGRSFTSSSSSSSRHCQWRQGGKGMPICRFRSFSVKVLSPRLRRCRRHRA
mmetsp:Transcript_78395/g.239803  ORF Transcript_78395/g.239803 Transcript_78395/m.239803 type:complete len:246 (+) Transcript_78395:704-1441(+)